MKKLNILAAAALVAFGTSVASAQDTTRREARGEVSKMATVASVMSVIDGSHATAAKIGLVKTETPLKVDIVDVKPIFSVEADQKTLKESIEKNGDAIKHLRAELGKNALVVKAIEGHMHKLMLSDIVGAELLDGDRLVIYFWKM